MLYLKNLNPWMQCITYELSINIYFCRGNTVELSLSGIRALEFDGDNVLQIGQKHHIIAIFVGTLMKEGKDQRKFLSGTSACRWYINENDISAIKAFQRRYTHNLLLTIYLFFVVSATV
jgi:hypothetical protein